MKESCLLCNQSDIYGGLWCKRPVCSTKDKVPLLENGEWLGEVEIIQPLTTVHNGIIYRGKRQGKKILIKIGHPGREELIKREARFLAQLPKGGKHIRTLPNLLPAYSQSEISGYPYGKGMFKGISLTFSIFEHVEGVSLTAWLSRNRQPWINHVGWITLQIIEGLNEIHQYGRLHLALEPNSVLIRTDRDEIPRSMLLDLGRVTNAEKEAVSIPLNEMALPYTPPELVSQQRHGGQASDVYSLGLCLAEMLSGQAPCIPNADREAISKLIINGISRSIEREDLNQTLLDFVALMIKPYPAQRPANFSVVKGNLAERFPRIPRERPQIGIDWQMVGVISGTLLLISVLVSITILP